MGSSIEQYGIGKSGSFAGFSLFRIQNSYGKQFYVEFPDQPLGWGQAVELYGSALDLYEYWLLEKNVLHSFMLTQPGSSPYSNTIIIYDRSLTEVVHQSNTNQILMVDFTPTDNLYWVMLN